MKVDYNPHPGEHIADEMHALGINQSDLARALGISRDRVSKILQGQRGITADTALRLGHWLGTSPEMWIRLQNLYDLRTAEDEAGESIRVSVTPLRQSTAFR